MKEFRPAKKRVEVSVGESVRILRELQELTQSQLSDLTGIPQASATRQCSCSRVGRLRSSPRPDVVIRSPHLRATTRSAGS
jgi:transcriptional regulator with XRE-family HTH domain